MLSGLLLGMVLLACTCWFHNMVTLPTWLFLLILVHVHTRVHYYYFFYFYYYRYVALCLSLYTACAGRGVFTFFANMYVGKMR
jgi:hypothetical protein